MQEGKLRAFVGRSEGSTVLRFEGALRYTCAAPLRELLDALMESLGDVLIVDLREVTFIDSTCLGLITRAGRLALSHCGRRAVIVAPQKDIMTLLTSAALDVLFVMVDDPPAELPSSVTEVSLAPWTGAAAQGAVGRVVLDAHRDLAALSARNREEYRDVIAALEADLLAAQASKPGSRPTPKAE